MTVGVIVPVGTYEDFLPGWVASVEALERKPDRIVVCAMNPVKARDYLDTDLDVEVIKGPGEWHFGNYLNHAVTHCDTDWITWIGADDRYLPHALNYLDDADFDVVMFGMRSNDLVWCGGEFRNAMFYNPVPCGSPFRRWIWEKIPFQSSLTPFEDWGFWVGAQHLGARAAKTNQVDFLYATHYRQVSYDVNAAEHAYRIRQWAATLT